MPPGNEDRVHGPLTLIKEEENWMSAQLVKRVELPFAVALVAVMFYEYSSIGML